MLKKIIIIIGLMASGFVFAMDNNFDNNSIEEQNGGAPGDRQPMQVDSEESDSTNSGIKRKAETDDSNPITSKKLKFSRDFDESREITDQTRVLSYLHLLPEELLEKINWFRTFELDQLPNELVALILLEVIKMEKKGNLIDSIKAVNRLRGVSKKFNDLINDKFLAREIINFWAKEFHENPVYVAILWNSAGAINWLNVNLNKENVNAFVKGNYNGLMIAARLGRLNVVNWFVCKGANVNATNTWGDSAWLLAAEFGHKKVVEYFLKIGVTKDSVNRLGETALDRAKRYGRKEVIDFLEGNLFRKNDSPEIKQKPANKRQRIIPAGIAIDLEEDASTAMMPYIAPNYVANCKFCSASFRSVSALKTHEQMHHPR